jgi:hypothetical protein
LKITLSASCFKIKFPKYTFLNFYLIVFGEVHNSTHFGILLFF